MTRPRPPAVLVATVLVVAGCVPTTSPTPAPSVPSATAEPSPSTTPTSTPDAEPTASAEPTATPAPSLSLDLPDGTDPRVVSVSVSPEVGAEGGEVVITVMSAADERIDELVLRWPTELNDALFLSPFVPSDDRIREGGPPLVQPWTKWVVGPGERGEPEGTISLGWGPLLPGATLEVRLVAERRSDEPIAFDLQVLAGNDLLTFEDGEPAERRVEVP